MYTYVYSAFHYLIGIFCVSPEPEFDHVNPRLNPTVRQLAGLACRQQAASAAARFHMKLAYFFNFFSKTRLEDRPPNRQQTAQPQIGSTTSLSFTFCALSIIIIIIYKA